MPRQNAEASSTKCYDKSGAHALQRRVAQRLVGEDKRVQPFLAARQYGFLALVPGDEIDALDDVGEILLDLGTSDGGGKEYSGVARIAIQFRHGKKLFGGQKITRRQRCT